MAFPVRNASLNVIGEGLWGLQWFLVPSATVLTLLLRAHGASDAAISVVAAIDNSAGLLPQVLAPFVFATHGNMQRQIVRWHFIVMIPCLAAIAPIGWLGRGGWMVPVVLALWAGYIGAIGVVAAVWTEWIARLFAREVRGTVMGMGWGASSAMGIAGTQVAGWLMGAVPAPGVYGVLYGSAAIVAYLSIGTFTLIRAPVAEEGSTHDAEAVDAAAAGRVAPWARLRAGFRASLQDVQVRRFLIARVLIAAGFALGPFITLHFASAEGGNLSPESIVRIGGVATFGSAVGCLLFGRNGDRRGHVPGLLIGALAQVAACLCVVFWPGLPGLCAVSLGAGIAQAAVTIAHNNLLIETCPHRDRLAHLILGNLVSGSVGLAVPLLWGWVAVYHGIAPVFVASLVLSLAGLGWALLMVSDPRKHAAA